MCGIAGIWNRRGGPVAPDALKRFTRSLAHRGPDGEGFFQDDGGALGLGHRRLAVLDLSESGHQPMAFAEERYWITFNGEIYNYLELRQELETLGYRFRSRTDTEVVLAAYDRWGPDCQLRFNGMWAFGIWDRCERSLFLSRDRWGVKPLVYHSEPGRFAFASEMKAFLHLEGFEPRENSTAMGQLLEDIFSLEGSEECLLQGVKRLPAGHCMRVTAEGERTWRWWNTLDHLVPVPRKLEEQAEEWRHLSQDACRLRLRSDVPLAASVSGGLDSSSVLCTLASLRGTDAGAAPPLSAFVVAFTGTELDEQRYAEAAVEKAQARGCFRTIAPDQELDAMEQAIYSHEDIFFTNPLPYWTIYREMRRAGLVVSLDGHGSDEMLGGYFYFPLRALQTTGSLLLRPRRTLDLANTLHGLHPRMSTARAAMAADPALGGMVRGARRLYALATDPASRHPSTSAPPSAREPWLRIAPPPEYRGDREEIEGARALGPIGALLYRSFHRTSLPTCLRTFDRCSMAHGIEARMPFLDWRLVCYTFSLPDESKVGGGYTKRVLREAMAGTLPEVIRTRRPKIGFNSPLMSWFGGPLRDWLWEQVNAPDFLGSDLWQGKEIREFVRERREGAKWEFRDAQRVWRFVHAHRWRHVFLGR